MYTLQELKAMPTITQAQDSDLKYQTNDIRIWLSRLTEEDGINADDIIEVEVYINGRWQIAKL